MGLSVLSWILVWAFWLATTHSFHPTFTLAVIVTTCLVTAYATAVSINQLVLVPRLWSRGRRMRYACSLIATMVVLTATALFLIRVSYAKLWGPDADPNGAYRHFAIDFFGMAVHLVIAGAVVRVYRRYAARRGNE